MIKNWLKKLVLTSIALTVFSINARTPVDGDIITIQDSISGRYLTKNISGEVAGEGLIWYGWTFTDTGNVYAQLKVVIKSGKTYLVSEAGDGKNVRVVPPPTWPAWVPVADSKNWSKNEQFLIKEVKPNLFKIYSYATDSWLILRDKDKARFHSQEQGAAGWQRSTEADAVLAKITYLNDEKIDKKALAAKEALVQKQKPKVEEKIENKKEKSKVAADKKKTTTVGKKLQPTVKKKTIVKKSVKKGPTKKQQTEKVAAEKAKADKDVIKETKKKETIKTKPVAQKPAKQKTKISKKPILQKKLIGKSTLTQRVQATKEQADLKKTAKPVIKEDIKEKAIPAAVEEEEEEEETEE